MDLDCLGSLILVKRLYPDFRLVRSRLIHPSAAHLYEFYKDYFDFLNPKDIEKERIEKIIIVDTCIAQRVAEYLRCVRNSQPAISIIDHHSSERCDILGASLVESSFGANTSYLALLARDAGVRLLPEEATIALTGIFADTGRLIYENVRREDFEAAAWLLDMGASLKLVKSFLETIKEDDQIEVLGRLLPVLNTFTIQGHALLLSYLELEENVPGLAAVVEKVMELQNPDAYFAIFSIPKSGTILLIARSQRARIDLHELVQAYGGGGHQLAASAKISGTDGPGFYVDFLAHLETSLAPAVRARDIMTREVRTINENKSLLEASLMLEEAELGGAPVVNDSGEVSGFIGLKDIMKGRKVSLMKAPVKAYMSRPTVCADSGITMREVERLFYRHHISHLVLTEGEALAGIISRWDYLRFQKSRGREELD
jgi:tRNA nucleotidyltransferase (CCA-adding enzyme)